MTQSLGPNLPRALADLLNGTHLREHLGFAVQVITVTEDGWPHQAMISLGELLALPPRTLRLAIWSTSTTARNLRRDCRCALMLILEGKSYVLRCTARPLGALAQPEGPLLQVFHLDLSDVLVDEAPYATLTSGIRFTLHDTDETLARWEQTVARLRGDQAEH